MSKDRAYPSSLADQFLVRLPEGMKQEVVASAFANRRSMNAEFVYRIRQSFQPAAPEAGLPEEAKAAIQKEMAARGGTFHEALMRLLTAGEQRSGMVLNLTVHKGMTVQDLSTALQGLAEALPAGTEVALRPSAE